MIRTFMLTCSLMLALNAWAAEPTQTEQTSEQASDQARSDSPGQASPDSPRQARPVADTQTRRKKGQDVFTPSEEISEDFAVSFPVDI